MDGTTIIDSVYDGAGNDVIQTTLTILEIISQQPDVLESQKSLIIGDILPCAVPLFSSIEGNARMAVTRACADIAQMYGASDSSADADFALVRSREMEGMMKGRWIAGKRVLRGFFCINKYF